MAGGGKGENRAGIGRLCRGTGALRIDPVAAGTVGRGRERLSRMPGDPTKERARVLDDVQRPGASGRRSPGPEEICRRGAAAASRLPAHERAATLDSRCGKGPPDRGPRTDRAALRAMEQASRGGEMAKRTGGAQEKYKRRARSQVGLEH